jgi:hypothetical protein
VSDGLDAQSLAKEGNQALSFTSVGSDTASSAASDGNGGTLITDPPVTNGTSVATDAQFTSGSSGITGFVSNPSLQWLDNLVETVVSDLEGLKPETGFQQLLNQIEGGSSSSGSGSASLGQPSPSDQSSFTAGWQSHMIQTLASFVDRKGAAPQESAIQLNDQSPQPYLVANAVHHS